MISNPIVNKNRLRKKRVNRLIDKDRTLKYHYVKLLTGKHEHTEENMESIKRPKWTFQKWKIQYLK